MIYQPDSSEKSSLREKVFNILRESILEGRYKEGDVLRETVIANELHVSRTPVREAVRQLELEGLVHSIPNKETVVTGVTPEDVQDIFMIRSKLEGLAGRRAAERITVAELEEMEEVLALTDFYIAKKDIDHINELDHRFHYIIYKATKSKILQHMLSDFHSYVQKARRESIATPGRAKRLLKEHTDIYQAIKNKNIEKVEVLMYEHIQNVTTNMQL